MKAKNIISRVFSIILSVAIAAMIIAVGYLTFCNFTGRVAYIGKYAMVKILTESMETSIPQGEYILVEKADAEQINVGDVIIFISRDTQIYGKLNTHRVIEITEGENGREFTTKGDNNDVQDSLRTRESDLQGRYVKNLPYVTGFAGIFAEKWVFFSLIIIPACLLLAVSFMDVIKKAKEVKTDILVEREIARLEREGGLNRIEASDSAETVFRRTEHSGKDKDETPQDKEE